MGQGKSNACRVIMLGAALDPLAELWVHVFAYNGDFDAYAPRLARYVKGAEEEQIEAAMESLRDLYAEVGRREQRLSELGAKRSPAAAQAHRDLRPRLTLFSECHELFGHRKLGEEATDLATTIIRRARKTAIWMGFDTQDARKDAIPPKIVEPGQRERLLRGEDVAGERRLPGRRVVPGGHPGDGAAPRPGRRPVADHGRERRTVRAAEVALHQVDDEKGIDDAAPVIARAVAGVAAGTAARAASPVAIEARDLLDDLDEVMGARPVRLADLPPRLRKLAPHWSPYRTLTGVQLIEQLDDEGVKTGRTGNVWRVDPADLRRVLAERGER